MTASVFSLDSLVFQSLIYLAVLAPLVGVIVGSLGRFNLRSYYRIIRILQSAPVILSIFGLIVSNQGNTIKTVLFDSKFGFSLGTMLDQVSCLMLFTVSLIGLTVLTFSERYLDGEKRHRRFLVLLSITISAVQLFVVSAELITAFFAWIITGMALQQLLLFYPERKAAIRCARKKFVISRLGDLALIGAIILTIRQFGTADITAINQLAANLSETGKTTPLLSWIGVLFVVGALTKSAQLPFHSWVPESLETPTPVSALMHAGIINAGGYLLIRISPIMNHAPLALGVAAIVGGLTAVFGMAAMVTQPTIKKRLAYSTVGQMGFMIMQCGLGMYSLAMLHIIAHAFYKAHAFLRSGSAMSHAADQRIFPDKRKFTGVEIAASLALSALLFFGLSYLSALRPEINSALILVFLGALAHTIYSTLNLQVARAVSIIVGLGMAMGLLLAYTCMAGFIGLLLGESLPLGSPSYPGISLFLIVLFSLGLLLQLLLQMNPRSERVLSIYLALHNGFYIGTLLDRIVSPIRLTRQRESL